MPFTGVKYPAFSDITVNSVGGVDLSGVISAELFVSDPSGRVLPWAWTVLSPLAASVHVRHTYAADGLDATVQGDYLVSGYLLTATSNYRIQPARIPFTRYP